MRAFCWFAAQDRDGRGSRIADEASGEMEDRSSIQGHAAVVTAGAAGIGAAIVERLAAEGARVALLDVDVAGG